MLRDRLSQSPVAYAQLVPGRGAALLIPTKPSYGQVLVLPRSTVYDYAKRRADPLPPVQIGRHGRCHRLEVERWLARQRK